MESRPIRTFQVRALTAFWDLAALADYKGAGRMLDIGCGTGDLTAELHELQKLPYTLGIDSSAKMLAKAPKAEGADARESGDP